LGLGKTLGVANLESATQGAQVRTMILRGIIVVAIVIVLLLVFAATKPGTLRLQRSTVINAPPEKVFALVNDFASME
jgi:hypothetical protein